MEERNLELDDDGKIRIRAGGIMPQEGEESADSDEIVIETPSLDKDEEEREALYSEEEYLRRRAAREQEETARRERAQMLCDEGERLLAAGKPHEAGVCFLDSAALNGADWRPWFGVVRVQTNELTDFTQIYDCEQAYDKALRRMSRQVRAEIAEKYAPSLTAQADELAAKHAALSAEDEREREQALPACRREVRVSTLLFASMTLLFCVFCIAAIVLWPFINHVEGVTILIFAIICSTLAIGFFVPATLFCKRYVLARIEYSKNRRAGSTQAGEEARILAEREEVIRSIIEDFTK